MSDEKAKILKIEDVFDLKLSIPDYQRPYKWTVKNVQQLVDDLLTHFRDSKVYRIGTIVLYKNDGKSEIVDGQQRLTTLSLLLHKLGKKDILFLDETVNHSVSKFNILENYEFINDYNFPERFKEYILKTCEMVRIELDDLDEAFQFFDSQNSKGKPLESYDLLKAYHLREMKDKPKEIVHHCVERWEESALSQEINNLDKIINYILFRLRRWHYQESGEVFTSDELETFKGVSESAIYPYLSPLFATKVVEKLAQQNPMFYHLRFVKTSFQTIQTLINGEQFFDYVQYYTSTFLNNQDYCYRVGDKYLKNLFECIVLFYFDKFGEIYLDEFINKAFLWVYRIRFEYQRITFKTIEDEAHSKNGLFNHIEKSSTPIQVLRYTSAIREDKFRNIDNKIKEIFEVKDEQC